MVVAALERPEISGGVQAPVGLIELHLAIAGGWIVWGGWLDKRWFGFRRLGTASYCTSPWSLGWHKIERATGRVGRWVQIGVGRGSRGTLSTMIGRVMSMKVLPGLCAVAVVVDTYGAFDAILSNSPAAQRWAEEMRRQFGYQGRNQ